MTYSLTPTDVKTSVRLLQMMSALTLAGSSPVKLSALHSFAYFANALSPLWDIEPLNGATLKTHKGPYYPQLQRQVDFLIAIELFDVESFEYVSKDSHATWFEAEIYIPDNKAPDIENLLCIAPDERELRPFVEELALAFSEIDLLKQDDAALVDAAYSDPAISFDRVVDFSHWSGGRAKDASVLAAEKFQSFAPVGVTLSRAEKMLMYMRLIKKRTNA